MTSVKRSTSLRQHLVERKPSVENFSLSNTGSNRHSVSLPVALESTFVKKLNVGDVIETLKKKIAFITGGYSRNGCLIITIPKWSDNDSFTFDEVITTLNYLTTIPRSGDYQKCAFVILINVQSGSLSKLKMILRAIQHSLGKRVLSVIIVKPETLSEREITTNDIKREKPYMDFLLYFVSRNKISKFIDRDQLTYDFDGSLNYSHSHWINLRMNLENFTKNAKHVIGHLESVCLRMLSFSYDSNQNNPGDILIRYMSLYETSVGIPTRVLKSGSDLIDMLETEYDSGFKKVLENRQNGDLHYAKTEVLNLIEEIKKKQFKLTHLWLKVREKLSERIEVQTLENLINKVVNWILDSGEKLLTSQISIGQNYLEAEKLRIMHEQIELRCVETYGAYAEARNYAAKLVKEEHSSAEYVDSRRDFLDNVCRNFASRIERRRNILITSVKFHRKIEELFIKLKNYINQYEADIVAEEMKDIGCTVSLIDKVRQDLSDLKQQAVKDGNYLCEIMVDAPTRNVAGLPSSMESIHVKTLIAQINGRSRFFEELVDLRKLRLKQINHLSTCERDAQQAIVWILELCSVMVNTHIQVGCNLEEVYELWDEHKKFEETAKGTYEYGRELLQAALSVRRICRYPEEPNTEIGQRLFHAWKTFLIGSAERTMRLKVCITYFKNSNEISERLVQLSSHLLGEMNQTSPSRQHLVLMKYQSARDRLLYQWKEINLVGQMLIKRLPMPVIPEFKSNKNLCDQAAAEQIKESICQVETKLAELQFLMSKSQQVENISPISSRTVKNEEMRSLSSSVEDLKSSMASGNDEWHTCPSSIPSIDETKSTEDYYSAIEDLPRDDSRRVSNISNANDIDTARRLFSLFGSAMDIIDISEMKKEKTLELTSSTKKIETKVIKTLSSGETMTSLSQEQTHEEWEHTPLSSLHVKDFMSKSSSFGNQQGNTVCTTEMSEPASEKGMHLNDDTIGKNDSIRSFDQSDGELLGGLEIPNTEWKEEQLLKSIIEVGIPLYYINFFFK